MRFDKRVVHAVDCDLDWDCSCGAAREVTNMRPCPVPHCGALIASGKYCPKHAIERDRARGTAIERGYGREWSIVSADWLRKFPWCGQRIDGQLHAADSRCVQTGQRVRATVTDHIVSIRDGGERMNPNNFQSLCNRCNVLKG